MSKSMTEVTHYVWILTVSDAYSEHLVGRLVRRNWKVVALGNQMSLHNQENLSCLVALGLSRTPKDEADEVTPTKVLDEVRDVLKVLNVRYHSVVITEATGCTWTLGNVTQAAAKKAEEERKKAVN